MASGGGGISEDYISPNARWSMFLREHPNAPAPRYEARTPEECGIPAQFMGDASTDIVCFVTVDPGDGGEPVSAWHEIPAQEVYYEGFGQNRKKKTRPFSRTPEAWAKLQTMTLGRALKKLGYPDDKDDLHLSLHFRQRMAELDLLRAGIDVKALTAARIAAGELMPAAPQERTEDVLRQAARPSEHEPDLDDTSNPPIRDKDTEAGGHDVLDLEAEPEDDDEGNHPAATAPPADADKRVWHAELLAVVEKLPKTAVEEVCAFADERSIDTEKPDRSLKVLLAFAKSKLPPEPAGSSPQAAAASPPAAAENSPPDDDEVIAFQNYVDGRRDEYSRLDDTQRKAFDAAFAEAGLDWETMAPPDKEKLERVFDEVPF